MRSFSLILLLVIISAIAAGAQRDQAPPDAQMIKQTIVEVFQAAEHCNDRDRMQLAIQPLLFVLARRHDAATEQVLVDLSTYRLGVANDEIYHCILTRRGKQLLKKLQVEKTSDCIVKLGSKSTMCLTSKERDTMIADIRRSINDGAPCDLEY